LSLLGAPKSQEAAVDKHYVERCGHEDPETGLFCTLPSGHDGPHDTAPEAIPQPLPPPPERCGAVSPRDGRRWVREKEHLGGHSPYPETSSSGWGTYRASGIAALAWGAAAIFLHLWWAWLFLIASACYYFNMAKQPDDPTRNGAILASHPYRVAWHRCGTDFMGVPTFRWFSPSQWSVESLVKPLKSGLVASRSTRQIQIRNSLGCRPSASSKRLPSFAIHLPPTAPLHGHRRPS